LRRAINIFRSKELHSRLYIEQSKAILLDVRQ